VPTDAAILRIMPHGRPARRDRTLRGELDLLAVSDEPRDLSGMIVRAAHKPAAVVV
jgi:hypothetical protein